MQGFPLVVREHSSICRKLSKMLASSLLDQRMKGLVFACGKSRQQKSAAVEKRTIHENESKGARNRHTAGRICSRKLPAEGRGAITGLTDARLRPISRSINEFIGALFSSAASNRNLTLTLDNPLERLSERH